MGSTTNSKAATAAAAIVAEGATLADFHAHFVEWSARESQAETLKGQAEKAAVLAATSAWNAGRILSALILTKGASMRPVAEAEGVPLTTVERLHRLGRLAVSATTDPTDAETVALWDFCKGSKGEGVSKAYDAVADRALSADALLPAIVKAAEKVRAQKAAEKAAKKGEQGEQGEQGGEQGSTTEPTTGAPETITTGGEQGEQGEPEQGEPETTEPAVTMSDVLANLAAWAQAGIALLEAGATVDRKELDAAFSTVARFAGAAKTRSLAA